MTNPDKSAPLDSITVLKCADPKKCATKTFKRLDDGTIEKIPYDKEKIFHWEEYPVQNIREVYDLLCALEKEPKKFIIRGRPLKQPGSAVRRRMKGDLAAFASAPRYWTMLDLDKLACPSHIDPARNPEEAAKWAIKLLAECFHDVTCAYQFSSSQSIPSRIGDPPPATLSLHFWFWCDRQLDEEEWKRYLQTVPSCPVDPALFNAVQAHYTAAPIIEGFDDPMPRRLGLLEGKTDTVALPPVSETPKPSPRKPRPDKHIKVSEDNWGKAVQLCVEHYPDEGKRGDFCAALAGSMYRNGWDAEACADFAEEVAAVAADEEAEARRASALRICDAVDNDDPAQGIPRLKEYVKDKSNELFDLLGFKQQKQSEGCDINEYLFREGLRLKNLGYPEQTVKDLLNSLNLNHEKTARGPLPGSDVEKIHRLVMKHKGPAPTEGVLPYQKALDLMNSKYAIVMESGKTIVIGEEKDDAMNRLKLTRSSFSDIKKFHIEDVKIGVTADKKPVYAPCGEWWLQCQEARRHERVVFRPLEDVPGAYNLWKGFGVEAKKGECGLFLQHLKENICQGNEDHYQWLMRWAARMIQNPGSPAEVAIVMRGSRGVGKGLTVKVLGRLLGQHYLHISNSRHLIGNFNSHLQDTILLFCDEAFWAGDKVGESTFKAIVTEDYLFIEPKGFPGFQAKNMLHIFVASNNDWVVPAGMDERRFFVLDVGDAQQQNPAYFGAMMEQMGNGGYEALLYELQKMDISDFDYRNPPKTEALIEQKLRSMDAEHKWLYGKLCAGKLRPAQVGWEEPVLKKVLQDDYIEECKNVGVPRRAAETELGMMLHKLFDGLKTKKNGEGEHIYCFPPLDECRKLFEKKMKQKIEWPDEPESFEEIL